MGMPKWLAKAVEIDSAIEAILVGAFIIAMIIAGIVGLFT